MIKLKRAIKIHSGYVITDTKTQTHLIQVKVGKYTFHFKLLRRVQWHGIHVNCFSICVWAIGRVSTKIFGTKTENYFLKNLKKLKIFLPDGRIKLLRYFIARWKLELLDARGPWWHSSCVLYVQETFVFFLPASLLFLFPSFHVSWHSNWFVAIYIRLIDQRRYSPQHPFQEESEETLRDSSCATCLSLVCHSCVGVRFYKLFQTYFA